VFGIYEDARISGAKGRNRRPGLDALLTDATRVRFTAMMAWTMDRLGRSLMDLLSTLEEARVDLFSISRRSIPPHQPAEKHKSLLLMKQRPKALVRRRQGIHIAAAPHELQQPFGCLQIPLVTGLMKRNQELQIEIHRNSRAAVSGLQLSAQDIVLVAYCTGKALHLAQALCVSGRRYIHPEWHEKHSPSAAQR